MIFCVFLNGFVMSLRSGQIPFQLSINLSIFLNIYIFLLTCPKKEGNREEEKPKEGNEDQAF